MDYEEETESSRFKKDLKEKYLEFLTNRDVRTQLIKLNESHEFPLDTCYIALTAEEEIPMNELFEVMELLEYLKNKYLELNQPVNQETYNSSSDEDEGEVIKEKSEVIKWRFPRKIPTKAPRKLMASELSSSFQSVAESSRHADLMAPQFPVGGPTAGPHPQTPVFRTQQQHYVAGSNVVLQFTGYNQQTLAPAAGGQIFSYNQQQPMYSNNNLQNMSNQGVPYSSSSLHQPVVMHNPMQNPMRMQTQMGMQTQTGMQPQMGIHNNPMAVQNSMNIHPIGVQNTNKSHRDGHSMNLRNSLNNVGNSMSNIHNPMYSYQNSSNNQTTNGNNIQMPLMSTNSHQKHNNLRSYNLSANHSRNNNNQNVHDNQQTRVQDGHCGHQANGHHSRSQENTRLFEPRSYRDHRLMKQQHQKSLEMKKKLRREQIRNYYQNEARIAQKLSNSESSSNAEKDKNENSGHDNNNYSNNNENNAFKKSNDKFNYTEAKFSNNNSTTNNNKKNTSKDNSNNNNTNNHDSLVRKKKRVSFSTELNSLSDISSDDNILTRSRKYVPSRPKTTKNNASKPTRVLRKSSSTGSSNNSVSSKKSNSGSDTGSCNREKRNEEIRRKILGLVKHIQAELPSTEKNGTYKEPDKKSDDSQEYNVGASTSTAWQNTDINKNPQPETQSIDVKIKEEPESDYNMSAKSECSLNRNEIDPATKNANNLRNVHIKSEPVEGDNDSLETLENPEIKQESENYDADAKTECTYNKDSIDTEILIDEFIEICKDPDIIQLAKRIDTKRIDEIYDIKPDIMRNIEQVNNQTKCTEWLNNVQSPIILDTSSPPITSQNDQINGQDLLTLFKLEEEQQIVPYLPPDELDLSQGP